MNEGIVYICQCVCVYIEKVVTKIVLFLIYWSQSPLFNFNNIYDQDDPRLGTGTTPVIVRSPQLFVCSNTCSYCVIMDPISMSYRHR